MARNDGIDRTLARNQDLETPDDVTKVQEHNEREKDRYSNVDIVPERTALNVHFKSPTDDYVKMFEQMEQDKIISTRGLKPDAVKYGELVFDVNSAYFYNHGGYEFAKQFYADAYKAAVEIVGGEQYILSAVMHQRILPSDIAFVRSYFEEKDADEYLFTREEMENKIDLHHLRACQAKRAYLYY